MIGDDDLDSGIFESDFGVEAVFDGSITLIGVFNQPSQSEVFPGGAEVAAVKPSVTIRTALLGSVGPVVAKMSCEVNGTTYQVEKLMNAGNGFTDIWLKTSNG